MAAIELEGLTKRYGDVLAADDLSFEVESGEIFGYLGPNGAGKTTTIRMLMGFISPTAGTARVLGSDVRDRRAHLEARRRIGYLSDRPGFDEQATGEEIVAFHGSVTGDVRSEALLEVFDPPLERRVRDYSRGNVQKLGLVTTFMHEPDLVILDEPTSGLDPLVKQRFAEFLRAERDRGVTVLFSSHVLGEARRLCDRVGIVRAGEIVEIAPTESLLTRSGKAVRLRAAEPIPAAAVDVEGVHDLNLSGRGSSAGGDDPTGEGPPEAFTECTFTFTGDVNDLLEALRGHRLTDLSIEEAPLEDVFMRFYGGED